MASWAATPNSLSFFPPVELVSERVASMLFNPVPAIDP